MTVTYPIIALADGEVAAPQWFADITEAVNDHETRLAVVESYTATITRKGADQSSSNTAAVVSDLGLFTALQANTTYAFEFNLFYSAGATVDLKVGLTWPTGATVSWMVVGYYVSGTNFEINLTSFAYQAASGTTQVYGGGSDYPTLQIKGLARVGSTAGNLQLQWGPNSTGTATVKADSWLRREKVIG